MSASAFLATANSFSELHALATFHQFRGPLQRPLRLLWERGYIDEEAAAALRSAMPHAGSSPLLALLTSQEAQRELKRRATPEVRRQILRGAKRLLEQPELAVVEGGGAPGRAEREDEIPLDGDGLVAWAQAAGIPEALEAPVAEVLGPAHRSAHRDEMVSDVIVPEGWSSSRRRAARASREEPARFEAACGYLLAQRDEARRAVEEEKAARPAGDVPEEWRGLLAALAAWRERARSGALPTTAEVRDRGGLEYRSDPPRFVYVDPRPIWSRYPPHRAAVTIEVEGAGAGRVEVVCGACGSTALAACRHALAAVDRLADWVRQARDENGIAIARRLNARPWERTVEMLRSVAGPVEGGSREEGAGAARLVWRVELQPGRFGAAVRPFLQKPLKRGGWSAGSPQRLDAVLHEEGLGASPADRVAAAAMGLDAYGQVTGDEAWLGLSALVGAGNVRLASDPDAPLRVELAELGLRCDATGDGYELVPAIDGAPVRIEWRPGEPLRMFLIHHDAERGRLLLARSSVKAASALRILHERGSKFPAEAAESLAEELSSLALPVALPESLLGRECAPDARVLVAAGFEGLALSLEAMVRPLPEGVTFPVGVGPDRVRGRRDGERVFARRNREEELRAAAALWEALGLKGEGGAARVDGMEALGGLKRLEEAERAGLEVLWPPDRPTFTRFVKVADLRVKIHGARFWFGLDGEAEIDGERLALASLLDAARRRERFVRLSANRWAELGEELLQKVAPLADLAVAGEQGPEITVAAAPVVEALGKEVGALEPAPAFGELLGKLRESRAARVEVPGDLRAELRPYQREGFQWLARLSGWAPGACLADDMGLGKTLQALALLLHRRAEGPALVLAPTSVCFNWEAEARRFAPSLRVISWHRCDRASALSGLRGGDVLVGSYGLLARHVEALKAVRFGTVVLDEAQNVKNAEARRSRAARELEAGFCLALTGTPLENHLGELWSLYRAVFPGLLGAQAQFRERFQLAIERDGDADRRRALSAILRPFLLRRTKGEVAKELPPRTEVTVPVALADAERRLYEEARLAAVAGLAGGSGERKDRRFQVLAALTRLRLLACHPRLHDAKWTGPASKLERFLELVEELLDEGHRALVFSQFTSHLALVREALDARKVSYQYLDGSTPEAERRKRVEAFQRGEGALFLISLKAGGSGLNLTAANHVIHLDPWWNPAVEDQATDRAHRIGQTRPVTVLRLVAQGTIEEQILSLHGEKRALLAGVLEGTGSAAPLEVEELVALLSKGAGSAMAD